MQFSTLLSLYSIALAIPTADTHTDVVADSKRSTPAHSGPVNLCFMCGGDCGGGCGCGGCGGCSGSVDAGDAGANGVNVGHGPGLRAWSQAATRWRSQRQAFVQQYAQQHAEELVNQHVSMHVTRFLGSFFQ